MQPPLKNPVLIGRVLGVRLSTRGVQPQVVMRRQRLLLGHLAASAQEDARVSGLGRAQGGEKVWFGAADVPVARVVARRRLVRAGGSGGAARVMPVVVPFVDQMRADVRVALMRAVGAVSV